MHYVLVRVESKIPVERVRTIDGRDVWMVKDRYINGDNCIEQHGWMWLHSDVNNLTATFANAFKTDDPLISKSWRNSCVQLNKVKAALILSVAGDGYRHE